MKAESSIHEQVEAAIKEGSVRMKPRWHFVLRGTLAVLGGVIIALLLLYLVSFIIFALRQTGVAVVPAFGLRGWLSFARHLPWLLIVFSLIFILLLELFVRRYQFAYRRPLFISALAIIGIVVAGGFVVANTSLHPQLLRYAQQHRLPVGERMYRDLDERRLADIYRGIIVATTSQGFIIEDRQGTSSILLTSSTRQPRERELLPGDFVVIFGDFASGTVTAVGVHHRPMLRMK